MGILDWLSKKPGEGESTPASDDEASSEARLGADASLDEDSERYQDQGQIAKGGMGVVRKVFNRTLLRSEAMKVLDPSFAADQNELLRFLEEAQITGQLDHPNIPAVHEIGHADESTHYFTMKLVRGKTLEQILRADTFSVADDEQLFETLQILIKVCDAIAFAHSRQVIHCDLKPANVMIGTFGQVYVMDWGIARLKGQERHGRTETGADIVLTLGRDHDSDDGRVLGTLGYMAPEQARGDVHHLDERTDVFALGALLYRVLTGRAPHVGASTDETWELAKECKVIEPQEWMRSQRKEVRLPARLCHIAMKALSADPGQRYPSVTELQGKLQQFMHGAGRYPTRTFEPGARIITQGERGEEAYVIQKGRVRVHREEGGASRTIRHLGPGEVFGETAILTDQVRSAHVDAVEPLTVVVIARDALERELGHTFWVGHILRAVADRFRDLDTRLQAQMRNPEPAVHSAILRYIAFNGRTRTDGTLGVGWTGLRRHLKQNLKLGDLQVMAMATGLPGLRIDEGHDEAVLAPDANLRAASGSAPAMTATPAPLAPVRPTTAPTEDNTQPPGMLAAFEPPAAPDPAAQEGEAPSPFAPFQPTPIDPAAAAAAPSPFLPLSATSAPLAPSPFTPSRSPTPPPRPKTGPLPALPSSRPGARPPSVALPSLKPAGARPPSGATPGLSRATVPVVPPASLGGTRGSMRTPLPARPPAATVLEQKAVVAPIDDDDDDESTKVE